MFKYTFNNLEFPASLNIKLCQNTSLTEKLNFINQLRELVFESLQFSGAVLIRGLLNDDINEFKTFFDVMEDSHLQYVEGNSPRTKILENIYTTTEYDQTKEISLHNEMSYASVWPTRLYFYCITPATHGGETTIANSREIFNKLNPILIDKFKTFGIKYIRNMHGGYGIGKSWQDTFETSDVNLVKQILDSKGYTYTWNDDNLCTEIILPALMRHPITGEMSWFNQAEQWHSSSLDSETLGGLLEIMDEEYFPHYVEFGNGDKIETNDLNQIRDIQRHLKCCHQWQKGDILIIDNILTAHGRMPFIGKRKILVSMV